MKHIKKLLSAVVMILLLAALFSGCSNTVPILNPNNDITDLTLVVTAEDITQLEDYPNLAQVDLRGSDCYEEITSYIASHPEVQVLYDICIGAQRYTPETTRLELASEGLSLEALLENLRYLPAVTEISLPETQFTPDELNELQEAFPNVSVDYSLRMAETVFESNATQIDLSALTESPVDAALEIIPYFPDLDQVILSAEDGSGSFTVAEVKILQETYPDIFFDYSFDLFGKTLSTRDEVIEYDEVEIGNEGEQAIREALDILTNCTYIKFDDCGIDSEVMASIRDDYPHVKVVWRIHVGKYSLLTDETMMRLTFVLKDSNVSELKYCTDIVYMDVGHNDVLTDLSFIAYMPKLECVIVSGCCISDMSLFANCSNLTWLEMCYCGFVKDLSPLKDLKNLKYLNISYTSVPDYSPLDEIDLERFVCLGTKASKAEKNRFKEVHPECLTVIEGKQPFGYGWRYNDYGYTLFDYYVQMREIFRYDDPDFTGNTKE